MSDETIGFQEEQKPVSSALAALCIGRTKHYIFDEKVVIGRSATAFLSLSDSRISRRHCVIEKTQDKFTICDTSNFGTSVNGEKLIKNQPKDLNNRDRIKLANLDEYTYIFLINKKRVKVATPERIKKCSPLTEQMIDLNETQSLEKDCMDNELNMVEKEMARLKEELNQQLKAREDELERERLAIGVESAHNKEQAEKAVLMLQEITEDKARVMKEYEQKIEDVTNKVEELQKTKIEMGKRHQIEREELENRCKAEIEDLKKKLEQSETKHQQYEELRTRLEETKGILLESELEQQRLFDAKSEVETKLESERKDKEEHVKELERKLKEKEELEEKVRKEIEGLEDDMMCSICAELYVEPTALNCGHMFCKLCIMQWSKKKRICPMCRTKISTTIRLFNMDSVIQRNVSFMSEDVKARREALLAERKNGKLPPKERSAKKRRHEASARQEPHSARQEPHEASAHQEPHEASARQEPHVGSVRRRRVHRVRLHAEFIPPPVPPPGTLPSILHRVRPTRDIHIDPRHESEGVDPFQVGWVSHQRLGTTGRDSPVEIAAVDLTNIPTSTNRTHTITSADANLTIDLTNL